MRLSNVVASCVWKTLQRQKDPTTRPLSSICKVKPNLLTHPQLTPYQDKIPGGAILRRSWRLLRRNQPKGLSSRRPHVSTLVDSLRRSSDEKRVSMEQTLHDASITTHMCFALLSPTSRLERVSFSCCICSLFETITCRKPLSQR